MKNTGQYKHHLYYVIHDMYLLLDDYTQNRFILNYA